MKLVKHPTTKNEMVPVEKEMHMLTGKRVSASRIKETDHTGDRSGAREAAEKASGAVNMDEKINTKAGETWGFALCSSVGTWFEQFCWYRACSLFDVFLVAGWLDYSSLKANQTTVRGRS